jgi:hypothetical protein
MAVLIFWALVRAFAYSRMKAVSDAYQALGDLHRSLMVSGCLIIIGCFLAWANLPYRQAFLLLALPGLLAMKDAATGEPLRLTRCTAVLLIALMWWDTIRVALTEGMAAIDTPEPLSLAVRIGFWLMGQLIWWHAIAVLGAVLLTFLKTSRAMSELRAVITRFFRPHADRT